MRSPPTGKREDPPLRPLPLPGTVPDSAPVEGLRMSSDVFHHPVMAAEIVDVFRPIPAGSVLDATVGAGGHANAILSGIDQLEVIGIDRDADALGLARRRLAHHGSRVRLLHTRFDGLADALESVGCTQVSGALFDLGVSSMQLDRPGRGFSYRLDGPLDMRMDRSQSLSAADVVNETSEDRLVEIITRGGGERFARRIAAAIVAVRPLSTTGALAEVVVGAIPAPARRRGGHPAKRTFQAIRIEVNSELDVLRPALNAAIELLVPGGRCAVLSYHSGEDSVVKRVFGAALPPPCHCPIELPCLCSPVDPARARRLLWRGTRRPTAAEVAANPRAESARLRVIERLAA